MMQHLRTLRVLYHLRRKANAARVAAETKRPEDEERRSLIDLRESGLAHEGPVGHYSITQDGVDVIEAEQSDLRGSR